MRAAKRRFTYLTTIRLLKTGSQDFGIYGRNNVADIVRGDVFLRSSFLIVVTVFVKIRFPHRDKTVFF